MPQAELGFDPLRLTGVWFQIVDQIIKWVSKVPFKIQLVGRYGVVTHHEINQAAVSAVVRALQITISAVYKSGGEKGGTSTGVERSGAGEKE